VFTLSALVLAALTTINVIAVGYNIVTVVRDNFNDTSTFWWSSPIFKPTPTCDPHDFNYGDVFFTNISIFKYNIESIEQSDRFGYSNVPLGAICVLFYYGVKVDPTQMTVETLAGVTCNGNNNVTVDIMVSYITYTLIDVIEEVWRPSSSVGMNLLDSLAVDLLIGVLAESTSPTTMINVLEAGVVTCNGAVGGPITSAQATACANGLVPLFITDVVLTFTNQSLRWQNLNPPTDHVSSLPATLAESLPNYLRAASAAILLDLGIWNNNSILASPAMLNAAITPNTAVTNFLNQTFPAFARFGTASWASIILANTSAFIVPVGNYTPAVIAISYNCHDRQRKSTLSFIISVIVADMSVFAGFWGALMAMTSYFALLASQKGSDVEKSLEEHPLIIMQGSSQLSEEVK